MRDAMKPLAPGYSVIIPCYGSEQTLGTVCADVRAFFAAELPDAAWELILVNDDSPDGVQSVIDRLRADPGNHVRAFRMVRNFGQHAATLAGIRQARYATSITMDDDGQHPLAPLADAIRRFHAENLHLLYLAPTKRGHGGFRDACSNVNKWCEKWILGLPDAQGQSAYRIFKTEVREAARFLTTPDFYIGAVLQWGCSRIGVCPIEHSPRLAGKSGYDFRKLLRHWWRCTFSQTVRPLLFAFGFGVLSGLAGVALLIVACWHETCLVPGLIFLIAGLQFLCLGLIGEYLGRAYQTTQGKPVYVLAPSEDEP